MVDEKDMGDVIEVPQEFLLLKNKYQNQLLSARLNVGVIRGSGSSDYMSDMDKYIKEITHIKLYLSELDETIKSFKQTKGDKTDDS
jgi:hypothetical protein